MANINKLITFGKCKVNSTSLDEILLMDISLPKVVLDCSENDLDSENSISNIGLL